MKRECFAQNTVQTNLVLSKISYGLSLDILLPYLIRYPSLLIVWILRQSFEIKSSFPWCFSCLNRQSRERLFSLFEIIVYKEKYFLSSCNILKYLKQLFSTSLNISKAFPVTNNGLNINLKAKRHFFVSAKLSRFPII